MYSQNAERVELPLKFMGVSACATERRSLECPGLVQVIFIINK